MRTIEFPTWSGEFGWEVMTWIPVLRQTSRDYDEIIASSFAVCEPLYRDFVTEFRPNNLAGRSLDYPKKYRAQGEHFKYGRAERSRYEFDVLIHARGIRRKAAINYTRWPELIDLLDLAGLSVGWIGAGDDWAAEAWGFDLRNLPLEDLTDAIAAAGLVVGVSSGLMHLAAACGSDLVVWGDRRTYFGETLEQRYKVTWNPHSVEIGWIDADDWQPDPEQIATQIERMLK